MNIEDLVQLLDNRLREFKLSKDYAKMSGNLERMNAADKEIIGLEDTLYQLSLLVDTSKSAAVKETTLLEAITDGSVAVLGEYDITSYATDPLHEEKVMNILSNMGVMDTVEKIDDYIKRKYSSSPVTGEMVMSAALAYEVDVRLMMAIMEQDSRFGTAGVAVRTLNPGNVGNNDAGDTRTYESWQEGVTAVAEWLSRHRGSTVISETLEETVPELIEPEGSSEPERPAPEATSDDTPTQPPPTVGGGEGGGTPEPEPIPEPTPEPEPEPEPQPEADPPPAEIPEPEPEPTPASPEEGGEPVPEPEPEPELPTLEEVGTPTPEDVGAEPDAPDDSVGTPTLEDVGAEPVPEPESEPIPAI